MEPVDGATMETTTMRQHFSTVRVRRAAFRTVAALVVTAAVVATAACGSRPKQQWYGADGRPASPAPESTRDDTPLNLAVTGPADGATNVPAAAEIAYTTDASTSSVELTDATGTKV